MSILMTPPRRSAYDVLRVTGGRPVVGTVQVRGAKNSVPKTMVAALLTDEPVTLTNVARIRDIEIVSEMLTALGSEVTLGDGGVHINAHDLRPADESTIADFHARSRIPVLTTAPLLHRTGNALIHHPGGCAIGERPVNMHVRMLEAFGAKVESIPSGYSLSARSRLIGTKYTLSYPSVGATEQFLLAAVLADGDSELSNAAIEPEIADLAAVLQKMGAIVNMLPDRRIRVTGVERLGGFTHRSMPDRLEAASWASAALATDGVITVQGASQMDMMTFLNVFRRAGGEFTANEEGITFSRASEQLRPLTVETDVHPGFMTDWQAPFVTALTQASGVSVIHETVYEDRLGYTEALNSLGANIQVFRECLGPTACRFGGRNHMHSAVIVGGGPMRAGNLRVPDLRAGFSYFLAALTAEGTSTISGASLIDRGYERFLDKLEGLHVDFDAA